MTKLMDDNCVFFSGQATRPYRSMGIHLVFISWSVTSSDASLPTLQLFQGLTVILRLRFKRFYCSVQFSYCNLSYLVCVVCHFSAVFINERSCRYVQKKLSHVGHCLMHLSTVFRISYSTHQICFQVILNTTK